MRRAAVGLMLLACLAGGCRAPGPGLYEARAAETLARWQAAEPGSEERFIYALGYLSDLRRLQWYDSMQLE